MLKLMPEKPVFQKKVWKSLKERRFHEMQGTNILRNESVFIGTKLSTFTRRSMTSKHLVTLKRIFVDSKPLMDSSRLTIETVEGASLPLEGIDNVH